MATTKMCKAACKVMTVHDRAYNCDDADNFIPVWRCRCCGAETKVQVRKPSAAKMEKREHINAILRAAGL